MPSLGFESEMHYLRHFTLAIARPIVDSSLSSGFRFFQEPQLSNFRIYRRSRSNRVTRAMCNENLSSPLKGQINFRLCNVSSFMTELLEIHADEPLMHVLLIPGNPGVVTYYKSFVESLYVLFGENVSVTAIGHISHSEKDWERGKLFTLQDQIEHKIDFIEQEMKDTEVPILLIGHSIGSYISLEVFNRSPEKVIYCIGLYPFLTLNQKSRAQSIIGKIAASSILSGAISYIVASLGLLGSKASEFLVSKTIGKKWSEAAVEATCTHVLKYHTMRNVLFMAMTEFDKLAAAPDWGFMKKKQDKISFLFGIDDHWGPLQLFDEISERVPEITLSTESEGHTHSFCCTEAGSLWVARHISMFMTNKIQKLKQ